MPEEVITLRIEDLAYGGDGVGRYEGRAVFVPSVVIDDVVRVRVTKKQKSFWRAEMIEIVSKGRTRRQPRCKIAASCGGCQWQQLTYEAQVMAKERILLNALRHLPVRKFTMRKAPSQFGYRRRARLCFQFDRNIVRFGYHARRSRDPVDVDVCPVLRDELNEALESMRHVLLAHCVRKGSSSASFRVDMLVNNRGELAVHVQALERVPPPPVDQLRRIPGVTSVAVDDSGEISDSADSRFVLDERNLWVAAHGFAQANAEVDRLVREQVQRSAQIGKGDHVLELFSGDGNLTVDLAPGSGHVVAVEGSEAACERLLSNVKGLPVSVLQGDATHVVRELARDRRRFDVIVADPPRSGMKELTDCLRAFCPQRMVYVSCNPNTLVRDLKPLCEGRSLEIFAFDTMPQTFHMEIVAQIGPVSPAV